MPRDPEKVDSTVTQVCFGCERGALDPETETYWEHHPETGIVGLKIPLCIDCANPGAVPGPWA